MHWMNMSVTIGSISAALLGVSGHAHKHWGSDYVKQAVAVRVLALTMMLIGICMAIYAAVNFRIRGNMLLYVCIVGLVGCMCMLVFKYHNATRLVTALTTHHNTGQKWMDPMTTASSLCCCHW